MSYGMIVDNTGNTAVTALKSKTYIAGGGGGGGGKIVVLSGRAQIGDTPKSGV